VNASLVISHGHIWQDRVRSCHRLYSQYFIITAASSLFIALVNPENELKHSFVSHPDLGCTFGNCEWYRCYFGRMVTTTPTDATLANSPLRQRRRSLLCLGIFRDCDDGENDSGASDGDVEDDNDGGNNSTDVGVGAGTADIFNDDWCLGIFRDCDIDSNTTTSSNCSDANGGIFGGRPPFGDCGIITELLFGSENGILKGTDTDGDGLNDQFSFGSNSSDKGPFGFGLLPEGAFLYKIFNRDDDKTTLEAIVDVFDDGTDAFSFGFIEDWSNSAVTTNQTCVNEDDAPACFDATGNDGFWVCRTLTDPYTAEPTSKSVCIGTGSFLEGNDACGCCSSTTNGTASPTCPAPCPCTCDRDGTDDGVWINTDLNVLEIENATDFNIRKCVDPRWAVSAVNGFGRITCLEDCPSDDDA
jgi:hypothetical protein